MNEERMNVAVHPVVRLVCGFPGVGKSHLCQKMVELLDRMWDEWITEMEKETRCAARFILKEGDFASDVISLPNVKNNRPHNLT
mgnify:CR=1 FL=1